MLNFSITQQKRNNRDTTETNAKREKGKNETSAFAREEPTSNAKKNETAATAENER